MTEKLAEWPSEHDQIIKFGLSDRRRDISLPLVAVFVYDWLRVVGYLGNVGLYHCRRLGEAIWENPVKISLGRKSEP